MSTAAQPTETVHAGEKLPQQGLPQQGAPERLYMPVRADKIVSSRGFYIAKIVMGCLILAFDVVVFGLSGGIAANYFYGGYYGLVFTLPVAILSFLWQVAEFITLCVQKQRGIHPGAHVGMHLIIWLGAAASVGLMSAVIYFEDYSYYNSYYDDYYSSGSRHSIYMLYKALVAFMALLLYVPLIVVERRQKHPILTDATLCLGSSTSPSSCAPVSSATGGTRPPRPSCSSRPPTSPWARCLRPPHPTFRFPPTHTRPTRHRP